ncbi:MAG TPA: DUF2934 domain-containing protein [Candidatus Limnocylindrales bacterium]|nr:DUF2934 domain-containing protein [Candidatus Limnocylindrales bacterium]
MAKKKTTAPQASKKTAKANGRPTHEEIALRAYQIFLERGGTPGNAQEDWFRAEQELTGGSKPGRKSKIVSIAA